MNWYLGVWKKFAVFEGRARRMEYWMFFLINFLIGFAIAFVESMFGSSGVMYFLYALAVLIPSIAVAVRRLHDTSRSGWWILLVFLPILGALILIVLLLLDSTAGTNEYGPNPKEA